MVAYGSKAPTGSGGVKVTAQLAEPPVPDRSHLLPGIGGGLPLLKTPGLLDAKVTVPVGVGWPPAATVTVHVVGAPAASGLGEQVTLVEDERLLTVTV